MRFKIFVDNLNLRTSAKELNKLFSNFGEIVSLELPSNHDSGIGRGFCIVTMKKNNESNLAVRSLNGKIVNGKTLNISMIPFRYKL